MKGNFVAELIYNNDSDNLFAYYPGEKWCDGRIDERVDIVAQA